MKLRYRIQQVANFNQLRSCGLDSYGLLSMTDSEEQIRAVVTNYILDFYNGSPPAFLKEIRQNERTSKNFYQALLNFLHERRNSQQKTLNEIVELYNLSFKSYKKQQLEEKIKNKKRVLAESTSNAKEEIAALSLLNEEYENLHFSDFNEGINKKRIGGLLTGKEKLEDLKRRIKEEFDFIVNVD
jgi:hypothetical protein